MHIYSNIFFLFLFLLSTKGYGYEESCLDSSEQLMNDLMTVEYLDYKIAERFPVYNNNLLQCGYINMPSARTVREGNLALGYSWVPPYYNWNARAQILNRMEITLNYRVFRGIEDPILSQFGFGDFSDKGANIKWAIIHPEDSNYELPGFAIGFDDFLGTRSFKSRYIVFTQVFMEEDFELSLGWGEWRIRGFFGGLTWIPFRKWCDSYLQGIAFTAEYDAIPYKSKKREPHPDGRVKKIPVNLGAKYQLGEMIDLSASWIRGDAFSFSASLNYNFGSTKGFVPKVDNPLPYRSPINTEPLGYFRPETIMIQELNFSFRDQGFDIMESWLGFDACGNKELRLTVYNNNYRFEYEVRERINCLLAYLIPEDINRVIVTILSEGFPIQEYRYCMPYVRQYASGCMGDGELAVLTPLYEASRPNPYLNSLIFKQVPNGFFFSMLPDFRSYFGSSKGKFKCTLGLNAGIDGYIPLDIYYSLRVGYLFYSDVGNLRGVDRLNPSQIINVNTDLPIYLKERGLTFSEIYLRKVWNLGKAWYNKIALGYFERRYGGISTEFLYYPVKSRFAFGIEGALLKKRTYSGLGVTDKIRKFKGFTLTHKYFLGSQIFANLYYDFKELNMEFRLKAGQFLAKDLGVRYEISRYFESGMRLTAWYTMTNGNDKINNDTYYDKGVMVSLPLDIFYTCSSRKKWNYGMSAWLRDVGFYSFTGGELYYLINDQRQN